MRKLVSNLHGWPTCTTTKSCSKALHSFSCLAVLTSFPGLTWLQFLIACSMQKLKPGKAWEWGHAVWQAREWYVNKASAASPHHLQHIWSCTVSRLLTILTPSRAPLVGWLLSGTPFQCAGWLGSACYWPTHTHTQREKQKIRSPHNWN